MSAPALPLLSLPLPTLIEKHDGCMSYFTDDLIFDATGVRIAFTERAGGVSEDAFASLNLSEFVGDNICDVEENRRAALQQLGGEGCALITPKQVHGSHIVKVADGSAEGAKRAQAAVQEGADGVIISVPNVAAMLCYADCIPVVIVTPSGQFAVVHAGWRGVMARIAPKALKQLCANSQIGAGVGASVDAGGVVDVDADFVDGVVTSATAAKCSECNIYIGPHIHGECFETSADVHAQFVDSFGESVALDASHVDLNRALRLSLIDAGASQDRIADVDICTMCNSTQFFSYRASGGTCGRHGAIAFRLQ